MGRQYHSYGSTVHDKYVAKGLRPSNKGGGCAYVVFYVVAFLLACGVVGVVGHVLGVW